MPSIAITIPQGHDPNWVDGFFDGTRQGSEDFPLHAGNVNIHAGEYVYLIYQGRIHGRLSVEDVEYPDPPQNIPVGTAGEVIEARTVVRVTCPGESAGERNIPRVGRPQFHYDDVPEW